MVRFVVVVARRSYLQSQLPPSPLGGKAIAGTRIIYPNGSIDPWHALGITAPNGVPDNVVVFINGTAHCANMYPPAPTDLPALTDARTVIFNTLKSWLASPELDS